MDTDVVENVGLAVSRAAIGKIQGDEAFGAATKAARTTLDLAGYADVAVKCDSEINEADSRGLLLQLTGRGEVRFLVVKPA